MKAALYFAIRFLALAMPYSPRFDVVTLLLGLALAVSVLNTRAKEEQQDAQEQRFAQIDGLAKINEQALAPLRATAKARYDELNRAIHTHPQDTSNIRAKAFAAGNAIADMVIPDCVAQASYFAILTPDERQGVGGISLPNETLEQFDWVPERNALAPVLTPQQKQQLQQLTQQFRDDSQLKTEFETAFKALSNTIIANPKDVNGAKTQAAALAAVYRKVIEHNALYKAACFSVFTPEELANDTKLFEQNALGPSITRSGTASPDSSPLVGLPRGSLSQDQDQQIMQALSPELRKEIDAAITAAYQALRDELLNHPADTKKIKGKSLTPEQRIYSQWTSSTPGHFGPGEEEKLTQLGLSEEQNQQLRILGAKFEKDSSKFWEAFQVKVDKLFSSIVGDPSDSSTIQAQVAVVADAAASMNVEYELYRASRFSVLDPTQLQQAAAITSTAPPLWP